MVAQISSIDGTICIYTQSPTHVVVDLTGFYPFGSSFSAIQPARLLESRIGPEFTTVDSQFVGIGRRLGGVVTEVKVAGRGGVPADAKSVAINLTAINPTAGRLRHRVPVRRARSRLHRRSTSRAGAIVPNAAMVKVGVGGSVCVFSNVETDFVLDVNGYDAADSGGAVPRSDPRARDPSWPCVLPTTCWRAAACDRPTRCSNSRSAAELRVPTAIRAVVLNITVTEATGAGFVTVYPCSATRPVASTLNYGVGTTVANLAVATTTADGKVCIYTQRPTHLVVDLSGYHT